MLKIKRVYAPRERGDGERILVDRLWPRGLSRRAAAVDRWMKDLGPSHALRKWFGHDPARWAEFRRRYLAELRAHRVVLDAIVRASRTRAVTLLFGAHDTAHNNAVVLKSVIDRRRKRHGAARRRAARNTQRPLRGAAVADVPA
jgi:uncharacterized protein YeaO (DUF488 family)